jgi:hypothetical protein
MPKRRWSPLSPQSRIREALNAAPVGLSLIELQAHDYLRGLTAHSIAVCVRVLAKRGEVADHPAHATRVFLLTDSGRKALDIERIARARLAKRLRIEIPAGTYPDGTPPDASAVRKAAAEKSAVPSQFIRTETAMISRRYLRLLLNRAVAHLAQLTRDERMALAAAIQEAT